MIRLAIADDHTMFVDGIESILQEESDLQVMGRCFDGQEVIDFLKDHTIDVLLLDVNLPKLNGIEVCEKVVATYPNIKILAISMFNEESYVTEILNKGALGYILKNTGRKELVKAIHTVHGGQSYFSKEVTQTIMKGLMKQRLHQEQKAKFFPKISKREKQVLRLIIEEHTTQEIADKLFISLKTVESHRSSLLGKMNARNTAGLVRIALENNMLD